MDKQAQAALRRAIGMLSAVLTRQTALQERMLVLAEDKRDSIITGNLEKLEKTVTEERKLITEIEEEENNRKAVMPLLRSALHIDQSVEKLQDIIDAIPAEERGDLTEVRATLKEKLEEVQRKTRHNAELLKTSMSHVEAFLKTVSQAAAGDAGYNRNGRISGGGPTLLDRNA